MSQPDDLARRKAQVPYWREVLERAANTTVIALSCGFLSPHTIQRLRKAIEDAPPSLFERETQDD